MSVITNSAHNPGHTCLVYSVDGSVAYTGGSDCLVRIWDTSIGTSQEPDVATHAEDAITSISSADNCWCSGSLDSFVRHYAKAKPEKLGEAEVNAAISVECVAIDPKGKRVAVSSVDSSLKLFDLDDMSKFSVIEGHAKRARRVTWHPSDLLLTACCVDGDVVIWDVAEENPKLVHTIQGIIPAVEENQPEFIHDCSAIWHPSGQHFYLASRNNDIVHISRESWSKSFAISDESVVDAITALTLSANGVYLASASNSEAIIWSTQTRRLLFRQASTPTTIITQLAFSPTQNVLSWTDNQGVFSRWQQPIPDTLPSPVKVTSTSASIVAPQKKRKESTLFGDDVASTGLEDIAIDDLDDDWMIDDTGGQMIDDDTGDKSRKSDMIKEMVSITKAQPPFQPGSTPMEHKKRYLAYNMIGVIEVTDQDSHHIVNVEFHDHSARKGYHFTDHFKYDLGYLGERGAVFACPPEKEHPARVLYKPYGMWTSSSDWTYKMRPGVRIIGVTASGVLVSKSYRRTTDDLNGFGNVVVATSEGDLTFLSGTGRERRIMGLGAEYVSMVAGAEWVFVVHRAGSTTIDGSQNLSFSLFNFDDFSVRQTGILPLGKGHRLKWIGLTDEGAPAMYDTAGFIHVLTKFRVPLGASWARIMDTNLLERREGKDESYWPVGITGSNLLCVILKGRQEYPYFPKPLMQELPIRLPFRREPEEMALDESIERETLLLEMQRDGLGNELITDDVAKREMAMDKEFIKLIQQACKKDNMPRAIEVTKLLHHAVSFDMAIKVANFYHLPGLREKIEILKADREEEDRLVIARDKRLQWAKPDRPPRLIPSPRDDRAPSPKPLQDYSKPPAIHRPGLARVTPYVERSQYSAAQLENAVDSVPTSLSSSPDGKRKRGDDEDSGLDDSPKRRTIQDALAPAKPTGNPFARKTENKNPFARKVEPNKILQKSESFFDKVDAAETQPPKRSKGKEKEKKEVTRQTTLFGLPPVPPPDKKTRGRKKDAESRRTESTQTENQKTLNAQDVEMALADTSLPSDAATMVQSQVEESQTLSETQTQVETQSQTQTTSQEKEPSPEPIDWPPSPPAVTTSLINNAATLEVQ